MERENCSGSTPRLLLVYYQFELVKIHKQLEYLLLQASSISTGATVVRSRAAGPSGPQFKSATVKSTSSWHSAKEIIRSKGIFGLWSGYRLHFGKHCRQKHVDCKVIDRWYYYLVRDTIGTSVYFGGYETTKFLLSSPDRPPGPTTQFLAGGVCGILCWLAVFPVDLVKSLMQKDVLAPKPAYHTVMDCLRDVYHARGISGFYRGITVTLMRAFP